MLMTASAAADLSATPDTTWDADVVATAQIATCADFATHVLEGPQTSTTVYLLITADRTVTDRAGTVATSQFVEPRRMVLVDGRWLVDARVEGG